MIRSSLGYLHELGNRPGEGGSLPHHLFEPIRECPKSRLLNLLSMRRHHFRPMVVFRELVMGSSDSIELPTGFLIQRLHVCNQGLGGDSPREKISLQLLSIAQPFFFLDPGSPSRLR